MSDLKSGNRTIATTGTPVRLVDDHYGLLPRVEVFVLPGNTANTAVYIGGRDTSATEGDEMGARLMQRDRGGDSWMRENIDPRHVWIAGTAGEGVSFLLHGVDDGRQ